MVFPLLFVEVWSWVFLAAVVFSVLVVWGKVCLEVSGYLSLLTLLLALGILHDPNPVFVSSLLVDATLCHPVSNSLSPPVLVVPHTVVVL